MTADQTEVDALVERYGDAWLIWHDQASVWWRPDGHGYTNSVPEAGIFTRLRVLKQVRERAFDRPVSLLSIMARRHEPGSVASLLMQLPPRDVCEAAAERVKITDDEWVAISEVHLGRLRDEERWRREYELQQMNEAVGVNPFGEDDHRVRLRDTIVRARKRHQCDDGLPGCLGIIEKGAPHRVMVVRDVAYLGFDTKSTAVTHRWCKACVLRLVEDPGGATISRLKRRKAG